MVDTKCCLSIVKMSKYLARQFFGDLFVELKLLISELILVLDYLCSRFLLCVWVFFILNNTILDA